MSDFEEKPYWRHDYDDEISTLLPKIKEYWLAITEFAKNPSNAEDIAEFMEEHRRRFIMEYNRKEEVSPENLPEDVASRLETKRRNITNAIEYVFGDSLLTPKLKVKFDLDLAKKLHVMIGDGLIPETAIFREKLANPNGYDFYYLDPEDIEDELIKLFAEVTGPIEAGRDDWYKLATDFFNRFLFAHPFKNGNGRVARFLLSALLINYSIMPVCLYSWKKDSNPIYLRVLQEAHQFGNDELLKSFIIEGVHGTLKYCAESFDLID